MNSVNEVCEHTELNRDDTRGEITCIDCGTVLERILSSDMKNNCLSLDTVAQRVYHKSSPSNKETRSVDPFYLELGSTFDPFDRTKPLNSFWRQNGHFLSKIQKFSRGGETGLRHKKELYRMAIYFSIGHPILERATYLYQKYLADSKPRLGFCPICACLVLACREHNFSLTIGQMVDFLCGRGHRVTAKQIWGVMSILLTHLKAEGKVTTRHLARKSEDFLPAFVSQLSTANPQINTDLLLNTAQSILAKISKEERGAKNPVSFAIASIYASGQHLYSTKKLKYGLTQHYLATFFNVAEYTTREHWVFIQKHL